MIVTPPNLEIKSEIVDKKINILSIFGIYSENVIFSDADPLIYQTSALHFLNKKSSLILTPPNLGHLGKLNCSILDIASEDCCGGIVSWSDMPDYYYAFTYFISSNKYSIYPLPDEWSRTDPKLRMYPAFFTLTSDGRIWLSYTNHSQLEKKIYKSFYVTKDNKFVKLENLSNFISSKEGNVNMRGDFITQNLRPIQSERNRVYTYLNNFENKLHQTIYVNYDDSFQLESFDPPMFASLLTRYRYFYAKDNPNKPGFIWDNGNRIQLPDLHPDSWSTILSTGERLNESKKNGSVRHRVYNWHTRLDSPPKNVTERLLLSEDLNGKFPAVPQAIAPNGYCLVIASITEVGQVKKKKNILISLLD